MEYAELGKSGIRIPRLCVGCMSFGDPASQMHIWTLDPRESEKIVRHAIWESIFLILPTSILQGRSRNISERRFGAM